MNQTLASPEIKLAGVALLIFALCHGFVLPSCMGLSEDLSLYGLIDFFFLQELKVKGILCIFQKPFRNHQVFSKENRLKYSDLLWQDRWF